MLDGWLEFWAKYLYVFLLTAFFTFIGVIGRYLKDMKKNNERFKFRAFFIEFFISLSLTILLALACIKSEIDILTTCILVGVGGHFGTNGLVKIICKYIKLDCDDLLGKKEDENV